MLYLRVWIVCTVFGVKCMNGEQVSTTNAAPPPLSAASTASLMPELYDDYFLTMFKYNSEICNDRRSCGYGLTFPDTNCFCDKLCHAMNDCCENANIDNAYTQESLPDISQFQCLRVPGLIKNVNSYGSLMVAKCHATWQDDQTKYHCEGEHTLFDDNILLRTPVSDTIKEEIMFKNMYCAYCNYLYDFQFWNPKYQCINETDARKIPGNSDCFMSFTTPNNKYKKRQCPLIQPVSSCDQKADLAITTACSDKPYFLVYDDLGSSAQYRNEFCATCNGIDKDRLYCDSPVIPPTPVPTPSGRTYSFRLLVDLNSGHYERNDKDYGEQSQCENDEMYDIMFDICRPILCVEPAVASHGRCVRHTASVSQDGQTEDRDNCTWTKLNPDEYRLQNNDSKLFILSENKVYTEAEYKTNGSDVFICLDKHKTCLHGCDNAGANFNFDETESYVSMAGLIISIVSLAITFIVYVSFPQLLNTPGKILICLIVSLLLAQLLFLISSEVESIPWLCKTFGIFIHYFFLAAFCWMNVIAFDLWMTFSNKFVSSGSSNKTAKRLRFYNLYAWFIPMIIVCTAVVLDNFNFNNDFSFLKPHYGNGVCWIATRESLLLYFVGPLALFKLFDIVSFIFTAIHIAKAKRQGAMARQKKNTCSLLINIKLSLVMGLTWVFAFLASLTDVMALWYLFIVFNTLQGFFIALSFLCTKKVVRLIKEKAAVVSSVFSKSTSGTQLTTYSKTTDSTQ